jgi:glycosyltransferase involved in cell wall biosynthesis
VNLYSLVMLVKNPPIARLASLLDYMRPICPQVVVVVDDRTPQEAVELMQSWPGVEIVPFTWVDDFAAARNAALDRCSYPWTLHLDPDELPTAALWQFLRDASLDGPEAYLFWTVGYFNGTKSPGVEADWHIRLFRTGVGHWYRPLHELVMLNGDKESKTRESSRCVKAPEDAYLIHSKSLDECRASDALYAEMAARQ